MQAKEMQYMEYRWMEEGGRRHCRRWTQSDQQACTQHACRYGDISIRCSKERGR